MKPLFKGLFLGIVQIALVASLGGKMLYDRATRPRVWVRSGQFDPDLPIRGRYLSLTLQVPAEGFPAVTAPQSPNLSGMWFLLGPRYPAELVIRNGHLVAVPSEKPDASWVVLRTVNGERLAGLVDRVEYFLPEHAEMPRARAPEEELWVEATIPRKGPPRPIRLAIKKGASFTPLEVR